MTERLRIAIQKKGRLNTDSTELLNLCGIRYRVSKNALQARAENLPIDLLFVRDDDIPTLIMDGVCDLGIVGENVLRECQLARIANQLPAEYKLKKALGFGCCRLSLAIPSGQNYATDSSLDGKRIATTYPQLLKEYLAVSKQSANILTISGSVEIAPRLGMADLICDLVSTGRTLEENNLTEVATIMQSQAVLIQASKEISSEKQSLCDLLERRISGTLAAKDSKYIMFHAPKEALSKIESILPSFETPTIMPLEGSTNKVAVHLVSPEKVFWETLEKIKSHGASSILVLPIEKMLV